MSKTSKKQPYDKNKLIAQLIPDELSSAIHTFSNAPVHRMLQQLDPQADPARCKAIKGELLECATTWQHITLLEPAVRAACVLLTLKDAAQFHAVQDIVTPAAEMSRLADILTRYILNDPILLLDDKRPFGVEQELEPQHATIALVAAFMVRRDLKQLATLARESAEKILSLSELRVPDWGNRVLRLASEYEQTTYNPKSVAGSSST